MIKFSFLRIKLYVSNKNVSHRERARRRNCELDRGELSVVRLSPVKARPRAVSLVRSPRPPPTLELDTVLEERSDPEQTTFSQVMKISFLCQEYSKIFVLKCLLH